LRLHLPGHGVVIYDGIDVPLGSMRGPNYVRIRVKRVENVTGFGVP
jgi:hypothetical protein